jgi:uncharacterized protein YjbJ (UPF0337 family)
MGGKSNQAISRAIDYVKEKANNTKDKIIKNIDDFKNRSEEWFLK